ncbi:hypothetical protein HXX76_012003 [Chlamydomonas incerta]|uniref:Uncharacterized protein n=1 Tax=Chlamydomonas incerta TaxID=51695 RepID=A0A835SIY1_CHLIN|nr:hypothetical protein HXX76_012003 [Chlamydomonas incerta]|eukprot:KAG2428017.1 hypothetical protein HXX76_012003 [Chlamydomonas incerta]
MPHATRSTANLPRTSLQARVRLAQQKEAARLQAAKCAAKARLTTLKKDGTPSMHWPIEAGKLLIAALPKGHWRPRDPARYCAAWYRKSTIRDAKRPGRPRKLPLFVVASCLNAVVEMAPKTQRQMNTTALFVQVVEHYSVTARHLWREMKRMCPKLNSKGVLVEYRPPLNLDHIRDRVLTAVSWLRRGVASDKGEPYPSNFPALPHAGAADAPAPAEPPAPPRIPKCPADLNMRTFLERIIWIDAKKFYIRPQNHHRWGLRGARSNVVFDSRARGNWGAIHYYSAVSARYGAVAIRIVTGTFGPGYQHPQRLAKNGAVAKGPTEEEFKEFVAYTRAQWNRLEEGAQASETPIYSWDNARIHRSVREGDWEEAPFNITTADHTMLPPYSPDMHSVIELSHAQLMRHMTHFINERCRVENDTLPPYIAELERAFQVLITKNRAQSTTHRLFIEVMPEILRLGGLARVRLAQQKEAARLQAAKCAAKARLTTLKKDGTPSMHWPIEAGKLLIAALPKGHWRPRDPARYCAAWYRKSTIRDAKRPGRPRKLPLFVVASCLNAVVEMAPKTQRQMNTTALFVQVVEHYSVTARHLWREMKRMCPKLNSKGVLVEYRPPLNLDHIRDRVLTAVSWLRRGVASDKGEPYPSNFPALPHAGAADAPAPAEPPAPPRIPKCPADLNMRTFLERIIWIDAKKFYIRPQNHHRWGLRGARSNVVFDSRARGNWGAIHYYSAVSARYGAVAIRIVTGTFGPGYQHPQRLVSCAGYQGEGWGSCGMWPCNARVAW